MSAWMIRSSKGLYPALSVVLRVPITGPWTATVVLDIPPSSTQATVDVGPAAGDTVTLENDDAGGWTGTVTHGEPWAGRSQVILTGGTVSPRDTGVSSRYYALGTQSSPQLRSILSDITADTGLSVSSTVTAATLSQVVQRFTRRASSLATALRSISRAFGTNYRILRDGTLWFGTDAGTAVNLGMRLLDQSPYLGARSYEFDGTDITSLQPGVTVDGVQVDTVLITASEESQRVTLLSADQSDTGLIGDVAAAVTSRLPYDLDLNLFYPARSVAEGGSQGTIDIIADNPSIGQQGRLFRVPLRHGLPGTTVTVPAGARVLLGFEEADPTRPYVSLWSSASGMTEVAIGQDAATLAKEQAVRDIVKAINGAVPGAADGGAGLKSAIIAALAAAGWNTSSGEPPSSGRTSLLKGG